MTQIVSILNQDHSIAMILFDQIGLLRFHLIYAQQDINYPHLFHFEWLTSRDQLPVFSNTLYIYYIISW